MNHPGYRQLLDSAACAALTDAERARVLDLFQPVDAPRKCVIYPEGAEVPGVYFVVAGVVKLTRTLPAGKTALLRIAWPGEMFGPCCNPILHAPANCTATALRRTALLEMSLSRLTALLTEEPAIGRAVVALLCTGRRACVDLAEQLAFMPVEQRLGALLVALSRWAVTSAHGLELPTVLSHEEMSQAIGTAREVVTRWLVRFQQAGFLLRRGRRIVLVSRDASWDVMRPVERPRRRILG